MAGGDRRWLVDPVDGTLNYARGLPAWCSAGRVLDGAGAAGGAVFDPVGGRAVQRRARGGRDAERRALRVGARAGAGRRGRGHVRRRAPAGRRDRGAGPSALLRAVGALRAVGCGTLELAWVAAGRLHGWVQADVEPWDWHPGSAGGAPRRGGAARVAGRWHAAAAGAALADDHSGCGRRSRGLAPTLASGRTSLRSRDRDARTAAAMTSAAPPSIADAVGGPLGIAESVLPTSRSSPPTRSAARTRARR